MDFERAISLCNSPRHVVAVGRRFATSVSNDFASITAQRNDAAVVFVLDHRAGPANEPRYRRMGSFSLTIAQRERLLAAGAITLDRAADVLRDQIAQAA